MSSDTASASKFDGRMLAIVPTFNEAENIAALLDQLLALHTLDVLVVDDTSPDGTGAAVRTRAATEPRLTLLERPAGSGAASAHLDGFRYALAAGYDLVVELDADLSHDPEDIPRLADACTTADIAVGSRAVPGARIVGRSAFRDLLTALASKYARVVLGLPVRDPTGGFRCTRRRALEALDLDTITARGYAFQLELNFAWSRLGFEFHEVPIVFRDRTAGTSKMSPRMILEALLMVPAIRLRGHHRYSSARRAKVPA
jgi:dolichol-phosphate mannosyltransferase